MSTKSKMPAGKVLDKFNEVNHALGNSISIGNPKLNHETGEMKIHVKTITNDGVIAISNLIQMEGYKVRLNRSGTGITITVELFS